MRSLIFISILLFFGWQAQGQISGYQGKSFSAGIGISTFPGVFALPADYVKANPTTPDGIALFGFHKKYEANANYTISRKSMVGLTGKYFNNVVIMRNTGAVVTTTIDQGGSQQVIDAPFIFQQDLFTNAYQIGVSYTYFGSGYVAPVGKAVSIEYGRIQYSNADDALNATSQFVDLSMEKDFELDISENVGYIGIGYSSSRVFFDRIIGTAGLEGNLVLGGERGLLNLAGEAPVYESISALGASLARKSIRQQSYLSLRFTISYLIF